MANDIDMWNDLEEMDKRTKEYKLLFECYRNRYMDGDDDFTEAEKLKDQFSKQFGYWGNYY